MRKAALFTVLAGLMISGVAEARWGRPWRGVGLYLGPVHAGFYAYSVYAPPPPPVYYASPVAYYVPPPVYYVAPPPVAVAPPVYYAPPSVPAPPPPALVAAPVVVEDNHVPRLAFKWSPLGTTSLAAAPSTQGSSTGTFPLNAGNVGIEYRFQNRVWALRSDFEYGLYGGAWDFASLKFSLFPNSFLRPFISAGITGTNVYDHNLTTGIVTKTPALGGVAAAGVDVFIGKHFFLEGEVKGRIFAMQVADQSTTPANATPAAFAPVSQFSAVVGAGVAFF